MREAEFLEVIQKMSKKRELFHSEDDLKFALSIAIKEKFSEFKIRLEKPESINMIYRNDSTSIKRTPYDIVLINKNELIPIELKYKTKFLQTQINGEDYSLTTHGAKDIGRFNFRKDLFRIEQFLNKNKSQNGFLLIITNDPGYYSQNVSIKNVLDSNFSFHNGATINKNDLSWNYDNIDKRIYEFILKDNKWKYREKNKYHWACVGEKFLRLNLVNEYKVEWKDYSKINNSIFKFCLIRVSISEKKVHNKRVSG